MYEGKEVGQGKLVGIFLAISLGNIVLITHLEGEKKTVPIFKGGGVLHG